MRPTKTETLLEVAGTVAKRSTCLRRQHGAVIVKDGQILSTGYNGAPSGATHCTDSGVCQREKMGIEPGTRYELCHSVHAEANAIVQAAKHGVGIRGASMIVTGMPCLMCARLIINAGIARVEFVVSGTYTDTAPVDLLSACGVRCNGL